MQLLPFIHHAQRAAEPERCLINGKLAYCGEGIVELEAYSWMIGHTSLKKQTVLIAWPFVLHCPHSVSKSFDGRSKAKTFPQSGIKELTNSVQFDLLNQGEFGLLEKKSSDKHYTLLDVALVATPVRPCEEGADGKVLITLLMSGVLFAIVISDCFE